MPLQQNELAMIRTYRDLSRIKTFDERFHYLSLRGQVGESTFGFDRWINQEFYRSREWRRAREHVLVRDYGFDMGLAGHEIFGNPIIHHMNPMRVEDITQGDPSILDPEFLITVSHPTHNAIHYGDERLLPRPLAERRPGDTRLW